MGMMVELSFKFRNSREYRRLYGVLIDSRLRDVSELVGHVLRNSNIEVISVDSPLDIFGNSWEMAFIMCMLCRPGAYTGVIKSITMGLVHFGPVPYVDIKQAGSLEVVRTYSDFRQGIILPLE